MSIFTFWSVVQHSVIRTGNASAYASGSMDRHSHSLRVLITKIWEMVFQDDSYASEHHIYLVSTKMTTRPNARADNK